MSTSSSNASLISVGAFWTAATRAATCSSSNSSTSRAANTSVAWSGSSDTKSCAIWELSVSLLRVTCGGGVLSGSVVVDRTGAVVGTGVVVVSGTDVVGGTVVRTVVVLL